MSVRKVYEFINITSMRRLLFMCTNRFIFSLQLINGYMYTDVAFNNNYIPRVFKTLTSLHTADSTYQDA